MARGSRESGLYRTSLNLPSPAMLFSNGEEQPSTASSPQSTSETPDSTSSDIAEPSSLPSHNWNLWNTLSNSSNQITLEDIIHESAIIQENPYLQPTNPALASQNILFDRNSYPPQHPVYQAQTATLKTEAPAQPHALPPAAFFNASQTAPVQPALAVTPPMQLIIRDIPAKSRIETQVKLQFELADCISLSNPHGANLVKRWPWIRVPNTPSVKHRTREPPGGSPTWHASMHEDPLRPSAPPPEDVLVLETVVICATPPNLRAWCCQACQTREGKRNARKPRPPSHSDHSARGESLVSPVDFTCYEHLDFSSGRTPLSFRVVCYCRHHREKVGFFIEFILKDCYGQVVAQCRTTPIMITDDHKTAGLKVSVTTTTADEDDGDSPAPPKRKRRAIERDDSERSHAPAIRRRVNRVSGMSKLTTSAPPSKIEATPSLPSTLSSPGSTSLSSGMGPFTPMGFPTVFQPNLQPAFPPPPHQLHPKIDRLIPAQGPMHGGIEITILGSNFRPDMNVHALFGNSLAAETLFWSNNVLICKLPPSQRPGPVTVMLMGVPDEAQPASTAPIFTYTDDGDRDLMAMALQLVGMRMSGQLQDARNVAISIIGPALPGLDPTQPPMDIGSVINQTQVGATGSPSSAPDFQHLVINLLRTALHHSSRGVTSLPGISTPNATGQTLLHIASMSGYEDLTRELIGWGADVDRRDANGWTALHFATAFGNVAIMKLLGGSGAADLFVVDGWGRTAMDIASDELRDWLEDISERQHRSSKNGSDVESGGDGDDEAWSEEDSNPSIGHEKPPLPVPSRAISRVPSRVSLGGLPPVSPIMADSPPPSTADVTVTVPAARPRPWHQRYGLPPMPWANMHFPGFNPISNIGFPDMPFPFVRPFGAAVRENEERGDEEVVGVGVDVEQEAQAQEQSMMMMMTWWGMYIRASWEKLALQQQQQQQQPEPDGPPPYSANPPENTTVLATATTTATTTTAPVDTTAADSSSPVVSGSQIQNQNPAAIAAPTPPIQHTYPPPPPPPPPPAPARPQRRVDYDPAAIVKGIPEHEINKYGYRSLVRRARGKKKDKMLIFFWIPWLFVVLTWAMYKLLPIGALLVDGFIRPHFPPSWSESLNGGQW